MLETYNKLHTNKRLLYYYIKRDIALIIYLAEN